MYKLLVSYKTLMRLHGHVIELRNDVIADTASVRAVLQHGAGDLAGLGARSHGGDPRLLLVSALSEQGRLFEQEDENDGRRKLDNVQEDEHADEAAIRAQ